MQLWIFIILFIARSQSFKVYDEDLHIHLDLSSGAKNSFGSSVQNRIGRTTELDALFIGPGDDDDYVGVVLDIPSLKKSSCILPVNMQVESYNGYVGKKTDEGIMLCGGHGYIIMDMDDYEDKCHDYDNCHADELSNCFLLTKKGRWVKVQNMNSARDYAASVETGLGWWVTGGINKYGKSISSTEVWDGKTWKMHKKLPKALHGHCMVKINSTHSFLTGGIEKGPRDCRRCIKKEIGKEYKDFKKCSENDGYEECPFNDKWFDENYAICLICSHVYSVSSYIFDGKVFHPVADMSMPRANHACGLHSDDHIIVAGGKNDEISDIRTSEFFSLKTMTWSKGPSFDSEAVGGQIVSTNKRTLLIGNTNIYLLSKTGSKWEKAAELEDATKNFDSFLISTKDCKDWNTDDFYNIG